MECIRTSLQILHVRVHVFCLFKQFFFVQKEVVLLDGIQVEFSVCLQINLLVIFIVGEYEVIWIDLALSEISRLDHFEHLIDFFDEHLALVFLFLDELLILLVLQILLDRPD